MNERYDIVQRERFKKIKELYKNKKYDSVIKESTTYLSINPNETHIRFMRGKSYRKKEMFKEAIHDFKYNIKLDDNQYSLVSLYYTYYYLNMYEEALDLIPKLYTKKCMHLKSLIISENIMRQHLGIKLRQKPEYMNNYISNQIENYDEESAKEHITSKHVFGAKENNSLFNENINVEYLFELIRQNINSNKKANIEEILEVHFFAIPNIGYKNDIVCNFVKVVVIPNTNKIISFYPENNVYDSKYSILEYDRDKLINKPKELVKTNSRIDKFNKRYNR